MKTIAEQRRGTVALEKNPLTMRICLVCLTLVAVFAVSAARADPPPTNAIDQLASGTVSRLEWGIEKLRRSLLETFAIDPLTFAPSTPPFFINVSYKTGKHAIEIEIGRTFPSVTAERAKELCTEYIGRVRGLLSVDRSGRPAVNGVSSIAEDYFLAPGQAATADTKFAQALDRSVVLRALVASPLNGVYSICTTALTHSPIRHIQ